MKLNELFVSHKQVDPISFEKDTPELPKNIYFNLDRAQKAASDKSEDTSTWKVGNDNSSYNWKVDYGKSNTAVSSQVEMLKQQSGIPCFLLQKYKCFLNFFVQLMLSYG